MGSAPTTYAYFVACERMPLAMNKTSICANQILGLLDPYVGSLNSEIALTGLKMFSVGFDTELEVVTGGGSISISLVGDDIT
ncbi:unnamed protein product [Schistosoma intercalatum]|nr:unnamed protein product [Schistosoma intercalatum]